MFAFSRKRIEDLNKIFNKKYCMFIIRIIRKIIKDYFVNKMLCKEIPKYYEEFINFEKLEEKNFKN